MVAELQDATKIASTGSSLSIVIPAYNEEPRIGSTLERIATYLQEKTWEWELVVVDDGSQDRTVEVIQQQGIANCRVLLNESNRGKGFSIRRGMLAARGAFRLFSDADLSTPIEELEKLLPYAEQGYEVVIGSRGLKESMIEVHQPFYREFMGRVFNLLVRLLLVSGIKDTQCGFKLFSAEAAEKIFPLQSLSGFAFDVELLVLARRFGFRVKEVPIRWIDSPASRVSPLRDARRMFTDLLRLRFKKYPK